MRSGLYENVDCSQISLIPVNNFIFTDCLVLYCG